MNKSKSVILKNIFYLQVAGIIIFPVRITLSSICLAFSITEEEVQAKLNIALSEVLFLFGKLEKERAIYAN